MAINYENPVVWSVSRADTAAQCMFKYKKIYEDGFTIHGKALALGTKMHSIMADELEVDNSDLTLLRKKLENTSYSVDPECGPEIYAMLPNVVKFVSNFRALKEKLEFTPTIEKQYAVTRDWTETKFKGTDAYIRGVIDLWAYSKKDNKLIILDHKTNTNLSSSNKVGESTQLNLYAYMMKRIHNLDVDKAHLSLHFLRHGKTVWYTASFKEIEEKVQKFLHLLSVLEERIIESRETGIWEPNPNFFCKWCNFRDFCEQERTRTLDSLEEESVEKAVEPEEKDADILT